MHLYEIRPRSDKRGVDLISDALPFGRLYREHENPSKNGAFDGNFDEVHRKNISVSSDHDHG